jgi:DNA-binding Lrp family transcriptional regulator
VLCVLRNHPAVGAGRRRRKLDIDSHIESCSARRYALHPGLSDQVFIQTQAAKLILGPIKTIAHTIEVPPEIIRAWTLTGKADYLLRVFCEGLSSLNRLIQQVLTPHAGVARVQSKFVLSQ